MSIASAIQNAQGKVADCYTAISGKGGTLPATQNLSNMPTAINSIPSGGTINNQDKTITQNGTYTADEGYTGLGTVTVNVGNNKRKFGISIDDLIGDLSNGQYQVRTTADVDVSFDGLTSFQKLNGSSSNGTWVMAYIFTNSQCIRSVTFPSITSIASYPYSSLGYFCYGSRSIETVSFPALTSVGSQNTFSHAFDDCRKLSTVSFPVLETVSGTGNFQHAFNGTVMLKTISFPSLVNANGFINAFTASGIETVQFPLLSNIGSTMVFYQTFVSCKKLTNIYFNSLTTTSFGSYTDQFNNIFDTVTGLDSGAFTMHFPSNLETTIQGLTGYPTFGSYNNRLTLAFDLTATS